LYFPSACSFCDYLFGSSCAVVSVVLLSAHERRKFLRGNSQQNALVCSCYQRTVRIFVIYRYIFPLIIVPHISSGDALFVLFMGFFLYERFKPPLTKCPVMCLSFHFFTLLTIRSSNIL